MTLSRSEIQHIKRDAPLASFNLVERNRKLRLVIETLQKAVAWEIIQYLDTTSEAPDDLTALLSASAEWVPLRENLVSDLNAAHLDHHWSNSGLEIQHDQQTKTH